MPHIVSRRRWGRTQTRRLRSGASRTVCLLFLFLAAALYGTLMLRADELFASDVAEMVASEQELPHPYGNAAAAHDGGTALEPYVLAITNHIGSDTPRK